MFAVGKRSEFHGLFRVSKYQERHVSNGLNPFAVKALSPLSRNVQREPTELMPARRSTGWRRKKKKERLFHGRARKRRSFTLVHSAIIRRLDPRISLLSANDTCATTITRYQHRYHSVSDSVVDVSVIVALPLPRKRGEDDTKKEERERD